MHSFSGSESSRAVLFDVWPFFFSLQAICLAFFLSRIFLFGCSGLLLLPPDRKLCWKVQYTVAEYIRICRCCLFLCSRWQREEFRLLYCNVCSQWTS